MLQSMGWKKGNGLGKNQQGSSDFIQVRYKNNSSGIGFDRLKDNQWTDTEHNFNALLQNLNSNSNNGDEDTKAVATDQSKSSNKSLEEMSKQSRARVHYKKFTKGKDVYKYSEKDLANIFGKKSLNESEKVVEPVEPETNEPEQYKSSLIINTGISIDDYFKQKRNKTEAPDETTETPKKKKRKAEPVAEEVDAVEVIEEPIEDVKPKKKKKKLVEEIEVEESSVTEEISDKKRKKRMQNEAVISEESIVEPQESKIEGTEVTADEPQSNKDPERPRGANAVYSTDTVQIPTHVARKMASMTVHKFTKANLGNVVGYGMTEDIEIKVFQTKLGDASISTDKYSIYNMDKVLKTRVNPRKILSKIKKTKKSIQVI